PPELAVLSDELRRGMSDRPWSAGGEDDRRRGAPSRWSGKKDMSFVPLDPLLVVEVEYDQLQGSRFRHTTQFQRFRPDREPASCTYGQLEQPVSYDLATVLR